jgi:hypothetical protein
MESINRIDTMIVSIEAQIYQMAYFNARVISWERCYSNKKKARRLCIFGL